MCTTVDHHVRTSSTKLFANEKCMNGFAIAKLYFRIGEYATARQYLYGYLSVKGDCAAANKLLGHCYGKLKMTDKAILSYYRSLQLDSNENDVIAMSNRLVSVDSKINVSKDLKMVDVAKSENLQPATTLKLKFINHMHDFLLKEIIAEPTLPFWRINLIENLLKHDRIQDAFDEAVETEFKLIENFQLSNDWYNTIAEVLKVYKNMPENVYPKSWNYWLLSLMTIDKQIFLKLVESSALQVNSHLFEIINLLYKFDQILNTASIVIFSLCPERELGTQFISHYRGQWCLHAATVLFAKEKILDKNQWKNTICNSLPLLLIAFSSGIPDTQENRLKSSAETSLQLIQLWNRQGAFRCSQAGRTILSCITDTTDDLTLGTVLFQSEIDLMEYARTIFSDANWREVVFKNLFSGEYLNKLSTSYFLQNPILGKPIYEIPTQSSVENYEKIAQWLYPSSLKYFVYLGLGIKNLNHLVCHPFKTLNFSTVNLTNFNDSLPNQLDIETFLYAAILEERRILEIEKKNMKNAV